MKGVGSLLPQWKSLFQSGFTAQSKQSKTLRSRETSDIAQDQSVLFVPFKSTL